MTKVLIADDCAIVRLGVRELLKQIPGTMVAAEATTGAEVLKLFSTQEINLLILDLWIDGRYCAEIVEDVKRLYPKTGVIVFAARPEDELGPRAFRAGADGFLRKGPALDELLRAVKKVIARGKFFSAALQAHMLSQLNGIGHKPRVEELSGREYEVSVGLADGESYKKMAARLGISEKSISTYRARILEKLHLTKNADLIRDRYERRGPEQAEQAEST